MNKGKQDALMDLYKHFIEDNVVAIEPSCQKTCAYFVALTECGRVIV